MYWASAATSFSFRKSNIARKSTFVGLGSGVGSAVSHATAENMAKTIAKNVTSVTFFLRNELKTIIFYIPLHK
jgi:Flp pilus assembly CpaE family ATPase